jgi:hypothetical protein
MSAENSCVYAHCAKRIEKDFAALDLKFRGQIGITIIRMWQNDNAVTSTAVSCGLHHHDTRRSRGIASGCPMGVELVHLRSRKRFPHSPYFCSCCRWQANAFVDTTLLVEHALPVPTRCSSQAATRRCPTGFASGYAPHGQRSSLNEILTGLFGPRGLWIRYFLYRAHHMRMLQRRNITHFPCTISPPARASRTSTCHVPSCA